MLLFLNNIRILKDKDILLLQRHVGHPGKIGNNDIKTRKNGSCG